jgi:hypothetical protein
MNTRLHGSRAFTSGVFPTRDCCFGGRQTTTEIVVAPEIGTIDDRAENLRVGGRLNNAALSHNPAHPLILSNKGPFTQLVIAEAHELVHHAKTKRILSPRFCRNFG